MGEFKHSSSDENLNPHQRAIAEGNYEPLHPDAGDIQDGGLAVLASGSVAEISHPSWNPDAPTYLRVASTQLFHDGDRVILRQQHEYNPSKPTIGEETEYITHREGNGHWDILPDGRRIHLPSGESMAVESQQWQPEALRRMYERGSPISRGVDEHVKSARREDRQNEDFLERHDLITPPLGVDPELARREDISRHPYIQRITDPSKMPYALEFVPTVSVQIHEQIATPEAALSGLTYYQAVQGILSLITQASPVRDGSLNTSLSDHYLRNQNPEYVTPPAAINILNDYGDAIPHDWRELARFTGSPGGGIYTHGAPHTLEEFLAQGDSKIRSGEIVSISRTLGPHRDRLRLDLGTVEISNNSSAGGNHNKLDAVKELITKLMVGMQVHYDQTGEACAPLFAPDDTPANRDMACTAGQINSLEIALRGKHAELLLPNGSGAVSPREFIRRLIECVDTYAPEPVSPATKAELFATLEPPPTVSDYRGQGASDVISDFYRPNSPMTAAEAFRLASEVEPQQSLTKTMHQMALYKRQHIRSSATDAYGNKY